MQTTPRRPPTEAEAKALASAVRVRILRLCLDQPLTNRELAGKLAANPATVLHHVRKLVDTGFLAPQPARRGPRGAREIPYLATGKSWTLEIAERAGEQAMIEAFREDIALVDDPGQIVMSMLGLRLTPEEYEELTGRLHAWIEELAAGRRRTGGRPYSLFVALHPDVGRSPSPDDAGATPPAAS